MKNRFIIYLTTLLIFTGICYTFVPSLLNRIFYESSRLPFYTYSGVVDDFIAIDFRKEESLKSSAGKVYPAASYDSILPIFNYRQLAWDNKFPMTLKGVELTFKKIEAKSLSLRHQPEDYNLPTIDLNLLFEADNGKAKLQTPDDFFRLKDNIEFLDPETNSLKVKKTEYFAKAFENTTFQFPAKGVYGNNNPRKPYDQGFFIIDSKDELYHLMMIHGEPYIKNTQLPKDIKVEHFVMAEQSDKRFYGYIFTKDHKIFILERGDFVDDVMEKEIPIEEEEENISAAACAGDCSSCGGCGISMDPADRPIPNNAEYIAKQLDIDTFDINKDNLVIFGNILYWNVNITNEKGSTIYALDRLSLKRIKKHFTAETENKMDKITKYLFPLSLELEHYNTAYIYPKISFNGYSALIFNLIFALITFIALRKKKRIAPFATIYVLVFGIIGAVAIFLVPVSLNEKFNF